MEHAQLPVEGVLVVLALSRTVGKPTPQPTQAQIRTDVMSAESQLGPTSPNLYVHVILNNFAHEVILQESTVVGVAEEILEALVASVDTDKITLVELGSRHQLQGKVDPVFRKYIAGKLEHLAEGEKRVI
jgi:hypothetical protein